MSEEDVCRARIACRSDPAKNVPETKLDKPKKKKTWEGMFQNSRIDLKRLEALKEIEDLN